MLMDIEKSTTYTTESTPPGAVTSQDVQGEIQQVIGAVQLFESNLGEETVTSTDLQQLQADFKVTYNQKSGILIAEYL